jgi:uncharacterized protein
LTETILEKGQLKKELLLFLIITFAATYLLDFIVYMIFGAKTAANASVWGITGIAHMLFPATAAIICMVYFKSQALTRETKIIFAFFLIYAVLFFFEGYFYKIMGTTSFLPLELPLFSSIIAVLGLLTVIILNLKKKWREGLEVSKLFIGRNLKYYILIPLIFFITLVISYILNYVTGLGVPVKEFNFNLFITTFVSLMITGALLLWPAVFGEEYGWRVYLQDRLFPLFGGYKGVLILGIIWGVWHSGTILLGNNYPGQPILGNIAMIASTIVMGIIFSYAVLKTGSVWVAVLLHLITDMTQTPSELYLATSIDPVLSFGSGIYGSLIMAVFALILLRSKVWKMNENLKVTD